MESFWLTGLSSIFTPRWTGAQCLSHFTTLWLDLLRKTLVPPLVLSQGALVAPLIGLLVTLTSTHTCVLHYSTYKRVPGSVSIQNLCTVVLDYGEHLAYWFITSNTCHCNMPHHRRNHRSGHSPPCSKIHQTSQAVFDSAEAQTATVVLQEGMN